MTDRRIGMDRAKTMLFAEMLKCNVKLKRYIRSGRPTELVCTMTFEQETNQLTNGRCLAQVKPLLHLGVHSSSRLYGPVDQQLFVFCLLQDNLLHSKSSWLETGVIMEHTYSALLMPRPAIYTALICRFLSCIILYFHSVYS